VNVAAHITPQTLRSGDPEALAALCDRRGAAVFEYCRRAAGDKAAPAAAAEAFAQFRRVIQPEGALTDHAAAEVLLRSATRRSALVYVEHAAARGRAQASTEACDVQGTALVVYVENTLGQTERQVVDEHVAKCESCATTLRRIQDAEAAFTAKAGAPLPLAVARAILTALVHAAPVSGEAAAVRDEALRLLVGDEASPTPTPPPPAPVSPKALRRALLAPQNPGRPARLRDRVPRLRPLRVRTSPATRVLRGAIRFAAVVLAAAVVGVLLGIGLSAL
jgi:hypothetical protein